nr:unnamed protein product [Timema monikensis]
MGNTLR